MLLHHDDDAQNKEDDADQNDAYISQHVLVVGSVVVIGIGGCTIGEFVLQLFRQNCQHSGDNCDEADDNRSNCEPRNWKKLHDCTLGVV